MAIRRFKISERAESDQEDRVQVLNSADPRLNLMGNVAGAARQDTGEVVAIFDAARQRGSERSDKTGRIANRTNGQTGRFARRVSDSGCPLGGITKHYDPYGGTLMAEGAEADRIRIRYSSKVYDRKTGLYNFGFRYYSSSMGRFINRDPIGEAGGLNLYGFVENDPVNRVDLWGLVPDEDVEPG